MKLQGLSIIFVIIVIPMLLVLTYYIQLQVDTIKLQTSYDAKLLDATHDAMLSFEINTANEDLSSVADSLRTIIDASNNIFINTLSTNMGISNASKVYVEPYIPAILYTLYDGYYIYAPTEVPIVGTDYKGMSLEVDTKSDDPDKFSIPWLDYNGSEYIYNPQDRNGDGITDDSIFKDLGSVPPEDFGQLLYQKDNGNYTTDLSDPDIKLETDLVLKSYMPYSARYIHGNKDVVINYTLDNYLTIIYKKDKFNYTKSGYLIKNDLVSSSKNTTTGSDLLSYNENDAETKIIEALNAGQEIEVKLNNGIIIKTNDVNSEEASAIIYYTKAAIFSSWVYEYLDDIEEGNIIDNMTDAIEATTEKGDLSAIYSFAGKINPIFVAGEDPEDETSNFYNHKYNVIKNSIQYNLNLAMSTYNLSTEAAYDFYMPVISPTEWEKILTNVSIVSFMQGLQCGLKIYNNYQIVSSTNNELTVIPEEIYFVKEDEFNNESGTYHRIDCPRLEEVLAPLPISDKKLASFVSKEVKYDAIYDKKDSAIPYKYDHKNLACYTCIVDGNYDSDILDANGNYDINLLDNVRKYAYYVAIGKQRNDIYKMNAIKKSEGYEVTSSTSFSNVENIKEFKITFGHINASDFQESTVSIQFTDLPDITYTLNTNQSKEQTITVPVHKNGTVHLDYISIVNSPTTVDLVQLKGAIKSIKVIYE